MALATLENTLLAFVPINRIVPTTITRITASITAYSAMSWPLSSVQNLPMKSMGPLDYTGLFPGSILELGHNRI